MTACLLGPDGACKRHGLRHWGRFLELSQMENPVGEAYRRLWDRNPHPDLAVPLPVRRGIDRAKPKVDKGCGKCHQPPAS